MLGCGVSLLFSTSAWYSVERLSLDVVNQSRGLRQVSSKLTSPVVYRPVI